MPLLHLDLAPKAVESGKRLAFVTYAHAEKVQAALQQRILDFKKTSSSSSSSIAPPPPTLLSFTPLPTYTLGRRHAQQTSSSSASASSSPTPTELARLTADLPLSLRLPSPFSPLTTATFHPTVLPTPRGGLTTYHGPGQLVLWPVLDLRSPLHRHFSVRDYTALLERVTAAALGRHTGGRVRAYTIAEHPGVWVRSRASDAKGRMWGERKGTEKEEDVEERKIAALGVHLRRHVTGLGVAVNLTTPLPEGDLLWRHRRFFDLLEDEAVWDPWQRFAPCGIADRRPTSLEAEAEGDRGGMYDPRPWRFTTYDGDGNVSDNIDGNEKGRVSAYAAEAADRARFAAVWAEELAGALGLSDGVVSGKGVRRGREESWRERVLEIYAGLDSRFLDAGYMDADGRPVELEDAASARGA